MKRPTLMTDVLELSEYSIKSGLFGVNMNVNVKYPHNVRDARGLQDPNGKPIPDAVALHDKLTHVDDVPLEGQSDAITEFVPGPLNSVVTMRFEKEDGKSYTVLARRYTEIKTFAHNMRTYKVRPEAQDKEFRTNSNLIMALEHARNEFQQGYVNISEKMVTESKEMLHGVERTLGKLTQALKLVESIPSAKQMLDEAISEIAASEHKREDQEQEIQRILETLEVAIEDELNIAEATVHISDREKMQALLDQDKEEVSSLQSQLSSSQTEVSSLQSQLSSSQTEVSSLKSQLSSSQTEVSSLKSQLSSSKARVVELESERDAAASALAASQSEVTNLNADIATLKVTLASYQKEVLSLKDELASAKNNLDSTAAALAQELEISKSKSDSLKDEEEEEERKLRKQVLSLEKELSESVPRTQLIQSQSEVASLNEEVARQQRDLNGRDLIVMELRAEVERLKGEVALARKKIEEGVDKICSLEAKLKRQVEEAQEGEDRGRAEASELKQTISSLQLQLATSRAEVNQQKHKISNLEAELASSRDKVAMIEKRLAELGEEMIKETMCEGELRAQIETMVPRIGYEALRSQLDLSKSEGERLSRKLSEAEDRYQGQVKEVKRLIERLEVEEERIKAGKDEEQRSRKRIAALEAKIAECETRIKICEGEAVAKDQQIAGLECKMGEEEKKVVEARESIKSLRERFIKAEGEADTLRLEVASMVPREELLAVQSQCREITSELEAAERRVKDLEREAAAARNDAVFQKNTLRTYEKRFDELREEVKAGTAEASRLNEVMLTMVPRSKLDQAQDDTRVLQQTCDGLSVDLGAANHEMAKMATSHHQHLEALSNQLDSSRSEITRLQGENDMMRAERNDIIQQLGESVPRVDYERASEAGSKASNRVRELDEELRTTRGELWDAEGSIASDAAQIGRLQDQLASLTARNESLNVQMEGLRRQAAAMQSKAECSEAECMTLNKWLQQKEAALKAALTAYQYSHQSPNSSFQSRASSFHD